MFHEFNINLSDGLGEITQRCLDDLRKNAAPFTDIETTAAGGGYIGACSTSKLPSHAIPLDLEPLELQPLKDGTPIIAVDCSSKILGETSHGPICVLRGAVVWREETAHRYARYGPFLMRLADDVTPPNCPAVRSHTFVTPEDIALHLQGELERILRAYACKLAAGSVVLFDGALFAEEGGSELPRLTGVLSEARAKNNTVVGFSKKTKLSVSGVPLARLLDLALIPCAVDVTPLLTEGGARTRSVSRVFAAKLARGRYCFRADVDAAIPRHESIDAFRRIMGNDSVAQGYPETLRLAHILAVFTHSETLALQRILARRCGLAVSRPQNIRRLLFGPFGQWAES